MPRFFIRQEQIDLDKVTLRKDDAHHIARSLRMAVGEDITVCDMQGNQYECRIESFDEDREVYARILSVSHSQTEPQCRVRLFQALPKGDKLDTVIQKAVECGVYEIVPFESERCIVKVKADVEERKTERRQRIAAEAAKQCGRSIVPEVKKTVTFDEMLDLACRADILLFCYEGDGTQPLGKILDERLFRTADGQYPEVSVVIGSEGGFSIDEVKRATDKGMCAVGLGNRILRTETAPLFVLSCIVCATELKG